MTGRTENEYDGTDVETEPIMPAKFGVPAAKPWTVQRGRLMERISAGVRGPLTAIISPAGCGKTVLASSWVAAGGAPGPVVWLSLDRRDARPGVLWSYLAAGLARAGIPVAGGTVPPTPGDTADATLARLAAVISEQPRPVVVILDDTQVLTDSAAGADIDFLLRHAGSQLRLVVLSRTPPDLPLHRYRVAGSLTEIYLEELAFSVPEAEELFTAHGVQVSDQAAAALVRRTDGWAAGLRLAALCLQQRSPAAREVDGLDLRREIEDYFVAEVLDAQPRRHP